MSIFKNITGKLLSAFMARSPEEAFAMPKIFELPLRWPSYIAQHVGINTRETTDTQICAEKWTHVLNIMRSVTDKSAKDPMHEEFINHLNGIRASIEISNKDTLNVSMDDLTEIYRSRYVFDEISRALIAQRASNLSNVVALPGIEIATGAKQAEIVCAFKDKYIEMMETAIFPYLMPGWKKEEPQAELRL